MVRMHEKGEAPTKGLYALSRLLDRPGFRAAFFGQGGLAALHRLLADQGTPLAARRKSLAMLADLARWQVRSEVLGVRRAFTITRDCARARM